jgi:hypothetical protein
MTTELTQDQMAMIATAGCTASQMLDAGCTVSQMLDAGFTASHMLRAGCTASQMLDAGCTVSQMLDADCTASQMLRAGFTAIQMLDAGFTASQMLDADCTASQMLRAGFTAIQMLDAGFTASQMLDAGFTASQMLDGAPILQKPYTQLLADIEASKRKFDQSTFGPDNGVAEDHLCRTGMCTAGHLVQMAGEDGKRLKLKYGFPSAASLIHGATHPDYPCQNFGSIPDKYALAYIRKMAAVEAKYVKVLS